MTNKKVERQAIENEKETGRIEAFSDGVFAIAITLLVLDIRPPEGELSDAELMRYLWNQWPVMLAFLTSFATIGITWINHHRLFTLIRRSDQALLGLNLLLLLVIAYIPYPTTLIADYVADPSRRVAALLYNGTFLLLAVAFNLVWRYAAGGGRLLGAEVSRRDADAISRQYLVGPILYLVTFALTWVYVPLSLALNLLLAIFFAIPGSAGRSAEHRR